MLCHLGVLVGESRVMWESELTMLNWRSSSYILTRLRYDAHHCDIRDPRTRH